MKFWAWILAIIVCAVILLIIVKSRIPDMVTNNLSKKLKVAVSIDSMDFLPTAIQVNKMVIANPSGYGYLPKAFSSEEIRINAPLTRYLATNIVIDEIDVNDIYLGLEFDSAKSTNGNWTVLMSNYQKEAKFNELSSEQKKRTVFIKKLLLRNISVELIFLKDGTKVKRLPKIDQIELENISSEGGLPMDQLMNSVLGNMLKSVFTKENLQNMLKDLFNPEKTIDKVIKPFKGLFYLPQENDTDNAVC